MDKRWLYKKTFITFLLSRRRREIYCGHPRLCLCVCLSVCVSVYLSAAACLHYCTDPNVTWGSGRGCPLVVHYWADLQSGNGLRCYGNITRTRNASEYVLVSLASLNYSYYVTSFANLTTCTSMVIGFSVVRPFAAYCGENDATCRTTLGTLRTRLHSSSATAAEHFVTVTTKE